MTTTQYNEPGEVSIMLSSPTSLAYEFVRPRSSPHAIDMSSSFLGERSKSTKPDSQMKALVSARLSLSQDQYGGIYCCRAHGVPAA